VCCVEWIRIGFNTDPDSDLSVSVNVDPDPGIIIYFFIKK
jgi:hypothetical protein